MAEDRKPAPPVVEVEEPRRVSSSARLTRVLFDGHEVWSPEMTPEQTRAAIRKHMK